MSKAIGKFPVKGNDSMIWPSSRLYATYEYCCHSEALIDREDIHDRFVKQSASDIRTHAEGATN